MKDATPVVIKPEPDWSSYRSSFDNASNSATSHQSFVPPNVYTDVSGAARHTNNQDHYEQSQQAIMSGHVSGMNMIPQVPVKNAFDQMQNSDTQPKKRGRKKKVKDEPPSALEGVQVKQEMITDTVKVKKKRDRFKGMTEEEVLQRVLPDHLAQNLDILIIGINPGLTAAFVGHHYAGPGNHFWKCLFLSGLIPEQMNAYDDHKLLQYGIGFTNIVERTSRGSADLSKKEIKEGGEILKEKVKKFNPKIAVFNGKGIYEVFVGHKKFNIGKQPDPFPDCENTAVFVMPSSSARFTQLPRAIDKVPFYLALKKFRDHLKGNLAELSEEEICFPDLDLKVVPKAERLAKEKAMAEANGQFWPVKEECDGETKPKRGRKKKVKDEVAAVAQGGLNIPFDINNQPNMSTIKHEPGLVTPANNLISTSVSQFNMGSIKQEPGVSTITCTGTSANAPTAMSGYVQSVGNYDPSLEQVLGEGSTLVKQEDLTELTQFGINPSQLQQVHSNASTVTTSYDGSSNIHQNHIPISSMTTSSTFWPPMCSSTAAMFAAEGKLPYHSHYSMAAFNQGFSRHMAPVSLNSNQPTDVVWSSQAGEQTHRNYSSEQGKPEDLSLKNQVSTGQQILSTSVSVPRDYVTQNSAVSLGQSIPSNAVSLGQSIPSSAVSLGQSIPNTSYLSATY